VPAQQYDPRLLNRVANALRAEVHALQQALDQARQGAEQTDGRALPVVAVGVVLAGVPELIVKLLMAGVVGNE